MRWMGVLFSILLLLAYGLFSTPCRPTPSPMPCAMRFLPGVVTGGVLAADPAGYRPGLRGVARLMQWLVP
jgi:AGCS family alanine or glycine:cation symporter